MLIRAHILNGELEHGVVEDAGALTEPNVTPVDHVALVLDKPLLLAQLIGSAELFDVVVPSLLSAHLIEPVVVPEEWITLHEFDRISIPLLVFGVHAVPEPIGIQIEVEVTLVSFFLEIRIDDLPGPAAGYSLFGHTIRVGNLK